MTQKINMDKQEEYGLALEITAGLPDKKKHQQ